MADPRRRPIFARCYARLSHWTEGEVAEHRRALLAGLSGRVVEVGAGHGLNFRHYPANVEHVLAVEPERHLRRLAAGAAGHASAPIDVVDGLADDLPALDASFDGAVLSLVLCSVPDVAAALAEVRRVVRPGGELRFFEHVRADTPGLARVQRLVDATIWPLAAGGCHTGRDPTGAIEQAGFVIEGITRFRIPDWGVQLPVSPLVLGAATRP